MGRGITTPTEQTAYKQNIHAVIQSREEKETVYQTCENTNQGLDHDGDFVKHMKWIPYCDGKNCVVIAMSMVWVTSHWARKRSECTPEDDEANAMLLIISHALEREMH